jgi:hypothetical protein
LVISDLASRRGENCRTGPATSIERQHLHDLDRRVARMRQPPRQFGARVLLDFIGKARDHLAENANLLFAELAFDENVGSMPQRFGTALSGAASNRIVEVLQGVSDFSHRISWR